jgi:uncharacterized membrane protein YgdD (TMEM256/DUF423 family)
MTTQQWMLFCAALLGFTGVAAGAFGAHALKQRLSQDLLAVFEVAVRYQMYHALALGLVAVLLGMMPSSYLTFAGWSFIAGTVIFSGSLYLLIATGEKWLGAITPIGGVFLLCGWLCLLLAACFKQ